MIPLLGVICRFNLDLATPHYLSRAKNLDRYCHFLMDPVTGLAHLKGSLCPRLTFPIAAELSSCIALSLSHSTNTYNGLFLYSGYAALGLSFITNMVATSVISVRVW